MQGSHERQLEREGRSYRFGSYKYSAQTLYDRGVLLSVDSYSPRQFDKVTLTISSDDVGEFEFSLGLGAVKATPVKLRLDDILEAQFVSRGSIRMRKRIRGRIVIDRASETPTGWSSDDFPRRGSPLQPESPPRLDQPQVRLSRVSFNPLDARGLTSKEFRRFYA